MQNLAPIPSAKAEFHTSRRALALLLLFAFAFLYLSTRLFFLQVFRYDEYQSRVLDEITVSSSLRARRGDILDSSGKILATGRTVYRIYISPKIISLREKESGINYKERIARGLSEILGISYETILKKAKKTQYLDQTIAQNIDDTITEQILAFVEAENLHGMILTEASEARYYPNGTLAAHLLGFTGSDNQGLFGLELYYEDDLSGENGSYLFAVDAHGNDKSYGYTTYTEPTDGLTLVTTLDSYIQSELEACLAEIIEEFDVKNRATGIVMNVNTGAILAMATAPTFDPNSPYELDELSEALLSSCGYASGTEEYKARKNELLLEMWKNKPITELYEPGSTFKIITSAMALDLGVTSTSDSSFFCGGSYSPVKGVSISCWRRIGHGSGFSYSYGLQQSCNCAMMQVVSRIGSENFYRYFTSFGLRERTGIDLPGEANSIFHTLSGLGTVELATSSFGQRFKVTPLQELTAIAAVANGGYLITPHLIDRLIDSEGNTVYQYETDVKRQVVSTEAARTVAAILEEGVSGTGASRNAYAIGYRTAAKTGTSEKLDKQDENGGYSLRIGSCVGFAPYDDPEIAVIIVVDEPTTAHYGATVAAPYISRLTGATLSHLGYEAVYRADEEAMREVTLDDYRGMTVSEATRAITSLGLSVDFGDATAADIVTGQMPIAGERLHLGTGRVLLYTSSVKNEYVAVPDLSGIDMTTATKKLLDAGLNIRLRGASAGSATAYPKAAAQSIAPKTTVPRGTVIAVTFLYDDKE